MGCSNSTPKESPAARDNVVLEGDFKVSLERSDDAEMFGVFIEQHGEKYAKITQIKSSGLIPAWNQRHENTPEFQLKPGDIIVSFNGISGPVSIIKKELTKKTITLWVKRASSDKVTEASPTTEPAAEPAAEPAGAAEDASAGATEAARAGAAEDATAGAAEDATASAAEDATAASAEGATESTDQDGVADAAKKGERSAGGAGDATAGKTPRVFEKDTGDVVDVDLEPAPQQDPKNKPCFFCGMGV